MDLYGGCSRMGELKAHPPIPQPTSVNLFQILDKAEI